MQSILATNSTELGEAIALLLPTDQQVQQLDHVVAVLRVEIIDVLAVALLQTSLEGS